MKKKMKTEKEPLDGIHKVREMSNKMLEKYGPLSKLILENKLKRKFSLSNWLLRVVRKIVGKRIVIWIRGKSYSYKIEQCRYPKIVIKMIPTKIGAFFRYSEYKIGYVRVLDGWVEQGTSHRHVSKSFSQYLDSVNNRKIVKEDFQRRLGRVGYKF